jgi:CRISPR-associated protein Cas2
MPQSNFAWSGYNIMWLFAMFDLPVNDKDARRAYSQFRNLLLDNGFSQMQYSIYARCCNSEETALVYRNRIVTQLPKDGHVRLLMITDRQFGKMEVYFGKSRTNPEPKPKQLQLF